jgi:hypothetical protein
LNFRRLLNRQALLKSNQWQKRRPLQPPWVRRTAAPGAARSCAGLKSSRLSAADRPEHGFHDVRGGNLDGGGVKIHGVVGFVLPDFRKRLLRCTGSPPHALQRPLAELERDGDWQISAASAKIVSHFSLETNGYRLVCLLPQRGRSSKFQTVPSSPSNGLVQRRIVWRLLILCLGIHLHGYLSSPQVSTPIPRHTNP